MARGIQATGGLHTGRRTFLRTGGIIAAGLVAFPPLVTSGTFSGTRTTLVARTSFVMGSVVTVTVFAEDMQDGHRAIDDVVREMREIESLLSVFDPKSQISLLNAAEHRFELEADSRVLEVLGISERVVAMTGGAFDPTVEPLMRLYGFREAERATRRFPTDAELADALDGTGMRNVRLDLRSGRISLLHHRTTIDTCGIGVGYALDRCAEILTQRGIERALINHSGDIIAIGSPPEEEGWSVGIVNPLETSEILEVVTLRHQALCTSGNYEDRVTDGTKSVGHIFDPRNGRNPSSFASVSVVDRSAARADALSTGIFVMGKEGAERLTTSHPDVMVHTVSVTDGGLTERWFPKRSGLRP